MYDIIKNIIQNGVFKISELTTKIDTLWAKSSFLRGSRGMEYPVITSMAQL